MGGMMSNCPSTVGAGLRTMPSSDMTSLLFYKLLLIVWSLKVIWDFSFSVFMCVCVCVYSHESGHPHCTGLWRSQVDVKYLFQSPITLHFESRFPTQDCWLSESSSAACSRNILSPHPETKTKDRAGHHVARLSYRDPNANLPTHGKYRKLILPLTLRHRYTQKSWNLMSN